ncbi:MAG: hypothetical protein AAFV74_02550 [Pseudomonadota bacterium]
MFRFFTASASHADTAVSVDPASVNFGHYMTLADERLQLFSIFDDLYYDRADADMLSPAMRKHAIEKLKRIGFRQTSGNVLEDKEGDRRCLMPKSHALGASPFDITRYTPRREQDYYILTPTQTACQYIDHYPHEEAVQRIVHLMRVQPINLIRLMDYLEHTPIHREFLKAVKFLKKTQQEAVKSEPLKRRRALG